MATKKQVMKPQAPQFHQKARGVGKRVAGHKTPVSAKPQAKTKIAGKSTPSTPKTVGKVAKPAGGKETKMVGKASPTIQPGKSTLPKAVGKQTHIGRPDSPVNSGNLGGY